VRFALAGGRRIILRPIWQSEPGDANVFERLPAAPWRALDGRGESANPALAASGVSDGAKNWRPSQGPSVKSLQVASIGSDPWPEGDLPRLWRNVEPTAAGDRLRRLCHNFSVRQAKVGSGWQKLFVFLGREKLVEYSVDKTWFFHSDHLGTPRVRTNLARAVSEFLARDCPN
jgi:hypothetical protein